MNSFITFTHKLFSFFFLACIVLSTITIVSPNYAYAAIPSFLEPTCSAQKCDYVFLAKIDPLSQEKTINLAGNGANLYLTSLYTFGIVIASGLAVLMVIIGGAQYASTDAIFTKSEGKNKINAAITGLVLALLSYTILRTLNENFLNINFTPQPIVVNSLSAPAVTPVTANLDRDTASDNTVGTVAGTEDINGAFSPRETPTIFGYKDGDGTVGNTGDNGLGNAVVSPIRGWTYYNGGAHNPTKDPSKYSQGVAMPLDQLRQDFGDLSNVKNSAYEIFVNNRSIGAFPVVDNSKNKLDLTFGLVKQHIDPSVTNSNTWNSSGKNIQYKPLKNFWFTNERPLQPMIKDDFIYSPSASEVDAKINAGNGFEIK